MIIKIIGLLLGAFVGYLFTDFMTFLNPARQTVRGLLDSGRQSLQALGDSLNKGPLVGIGIIVVLLLLILMLIGFTTALILGFVLGVVYNDKVESIPFVAGLADTVKSKLKGGAQSGGNNDQNNN